MREYGNVSIPQEAFIAALRMGEEWGGAPACKRGLRSNRSLDADQAPARPGAGEPTASRALRRRGFAAAAFSSIEIACGFAIPGSCPESQQVGICEADLKWEAGVEPGPPSTT